VNENYPYEGLILIIFSNYFLAGLRLGQALTVSMLLMMCYLLFGVLAATEPVLLTRNMFFLMAGSLIGAMGCYLLEYKSREHFLHHHLMRELVDRDSLTGLFNRRSFNRKFEELWLQSQRENAVLALLMCDVDHFKVFNDCYGHQSGDLALRKLGQVIGSAARRPLDIAVRMGGEEFAVLLYGMGAEQALAHAEALRRAVQELAIAHERSTTAQVLSISVGLACVKPAVSTSMSLLYERADKALYRAKAKGRNQVVQWEELN
jgi:diguanylate cyclase (GGDEF)-like protein